MKPPNVQFYTQNGRFDVHKNICTTFTAFHEESWLPTWNIENIIIGLRSMFTDETPGAVASIVCSPEARKQFAKKSVEYKCKVCGCSHHDLVLGEKNVKESVPNNTDSAQPTQTSAD